MSNFLAVDTSSRYLTVLAEKGDKRAYIHLGECAMKHSQLLMPEVDRALKEIDLKPQECDFFAAVTGPGSFTGIRIGIATAKGFALATGKPLLSVTSFGLVAYNVTDENFYVVVDAAHAHYYVCGYCGGRVTLQPSYLGEDEVAALDAPLYGFEDLRFANYKRLDAGKCLENAVLKNAHNVSDEMHALYVRKSQAEEGRKC